MFGTNKKANKSWILVYDILPGLGIPLVFSGNFFVKLEAFSLHSFKTSGIFKPFISGITWCCFNEFVFIITVNKLSKQSYRGNNLEFLIYFKLYMPNTTAN